MKKIHLFTIALLFILVSTTLARRPMTVEDLWAMKRIGEFCLSPDEKWIAFSLTAYDMERNNKNADIWIVPASGGDARQLTFDEKTDDTPRWKPDGSALAFLSTRDGSRQIYLLSLNGGEAQRLTDFPVDIEDFIWSPTDTHIAFNASVYPETKSLQESAQKDKERADSMVKARIIDGLFYRCFDHWTEGKRSHLFICSARGDNVTDVTPGDYDVPPLDLNGSRDFCFSPDGREIAFVSNHDAVTAISTNNDIFLTPITGGEATCITADNKAVDNQPLYSPDGKYLAYRAMSRPGFEADQYELHLHDRNTGATTILTDTFDFDVRDFTWSPDSKKIYFSSDKEGRNLLYCVNIANKNISPVLSDAFNTEPIINHSARTLFFKRQSVTSPDEIYKCGSSGENLEQLTFINKSLLNDLEMNPVQDFWFNSYDGEKVHGLIVKPPFFDESKKYPFIFLVHGGPQGSWDDTYHYRWNASMFAAPGYVVIMINFRGSKGYGQKWCDAVSKDWGGGPYQDLMFGLDHVLAHYRFIDSDRGAAAGASYGGFMMYWFATHTDRFKALVSHDGVFDQRSMYGATEELWFPEWEFNGTPYENPELYATWSPSFYVQNLINFKTPTLIIHGENDFRIPVTQGMQMFTALQRMGVPSRLILFPDETHFVTKPQNSRLWWNEIFAWIEKWINSQKD